MPCAAHALVTGAAEATAFARAVGFPLVAKPPAGAGSQATYRLDDAESLAGWLHTVPPSAEQPALLEEFLVGEEHTFDSVTIGGSTVWSSIADYQPPPLEVLRNPWIQWTVVLPRDISGPEYAGIHQVGPAALHALGVRDALTHMEWFRRPDGSVAVSEVAARPPGAQLTSMHGYSHDFDLFKAWAELVVLDRFDPPQRRYASGTAYLRGLGRGRVRAVHGVEELQQHPRSPRGGVAVAPARPAGRLRLPGRGLRHGPGRRHGGRARGAAAHHQRRPGRARGGPVNGSGTNVVMLSPGYPIEMSYFTRGLAAVGANVIGVGDQPPHAVPEAARNALAHYEHVSLSDEGAVLAALHGLSQHVRIDQVECLWEPYMLLAARIRETFGLPGMTVEQTVPFRDKEEMKRRLDAAGIRTPWHFRATSVAQIWEAAEQIGYPLIVKPIAGAGSADTYRVDSAD